MNKTPRAKKKSKSGIAGYLWPKKVERKQSFFMHKFVHGNQEYTVSTRVMKGGTDFILADETTVRDLSKERRPLSASELAEKGELLHNQCSFGELDTVSHLIEAEGISPNAIDSVSFCKFPYPTMLFSV